MTKSARHATRVASTRNAGGFLARRLVAEEPTSDELWGIERLEAHGRHLGVDLGVGADLPPIDLAARLRANAERLESAYSAIVDALRQGRAITPAAEWLVDNYHVISEQVGDIPLRLTPELWRSLPVTRHSAARGWPRIYLIASEYLKHSDYSFDTERFVNFLLSYQNLVPLTMRELWALYPIMRIALVDELRRLAVRVEAALDARGAADNLANLLAGADSTTAAAAAELERWTREPRYLGPFAVQLAQRLQQQGELGQPLLQFLTRNLLAQGTSIDRLTQREHARRSSSNLNVRNIMTSLRTLGSFDWRALFERTSRVELLLREQSSYRRCDRRTRDRYRSSIEDLAIATGFDETRVATSALELLAADGGTVDSPAADGEPELPAASAAADIGSVLIGWRRLELERALGAKITSAQRVRRSVIRHASGVYAGAVATLTLALSALALFAGVRGYAWPSVGVLLLGGLALFPASELAIGFVNRQLMRRFAPRHLPRLALGEGLEPDMKTLVVIPVMLGSVADAREAAQDLKVHALANPDPQVRFAVLSDWRDAPTETLGDDQLILDAARAAIAALNAEEAVDSNGEPHGEPLREPRYYLFHRRRQWNAAERCYMGWERKRGKLAELNRLLLRQGATSFVADGDGQLPAPQNIRYVLTLDADTRLPIGAVRDLVGIAAHPLNRPVYSAAKRRVVRGYGLLQPRITPTLPGVEERSLYRDIVTSGSGIDPYAAAVSDVYQDVFGQGLFTGKGLYVLDAFEAAMADRVPENALLSHDLFEGLFARCALVSDIELFEDFPSHSEVAAARAHRWIRGDWQLLPWILGLRGPLPPFGRWKMLDNLRRSLLAPLSIALLITSFCVSAAVAWIWLLVTLSPWLWPALISALQRLPVRPAAQSRRMHLAHLATEFLEDLERGAVALALLAQNAWLSIDAIGRALLRLTVTRRRLLEWVTAAQLKAQSNNALASFAWPLKGASVIVIAATGSIVWFNPAALPAATPLLLLWWLSPLLARFLSTPRADNLPHTDISTTAEEGLRGTARLTWRFFERFVTAEDNALPPDNFQETPQPVVAHRSSPTNFGLYLLSATAARDFGWLGVTDLVQRLEATLGTLDRLERCNGHFFNWYDTRTLAPLLPRYVSTVDSGNLAGHLQALGQAVLQIAAAPLLHPRALAGPLDALNLADLSLQRVSNSGAGRQADVAELQAAMTLLREHLQQPVTTLLAARDLLNSMLQEAGKILDMGRALAAQEPSVYGVLAGHLQLLHIDLASQRRDLGALLPTAAALVPALTRVTWDESIATLPRDCSLPDLQIALERALDTLQSPQAAPSPVQRDACTDLLDAVRNAGVQVQRLQDALGDIRQRCDRIVREMNFRFLFDRVRGLFSIGYRPSDQSLDASYYDLLASEARLTSFVAIAKGDVPRSHWFKLGRRLTGGSRQSVLASWSGSMFEYLMPALVMREPRDSLLDQTSHRIVVHQIAYGALHGLPWGVSESAYNVRDRELTYQYSGFGLPSLGLKRGLGANYVVAPYATALASMYQPEAAQQNFLALVAYGGLGDFGFYEAIDFTPARVPAGARGAVVRAWFAHHQGMSLVALDNALNDHIMQRRFHADPVIKAAELLLQERGVRFADAPVLIEADVPQSPTPATGDLEVDRQVSGIGAATPVTHLLSNRSYSVLVTDSGAGYSRCGPRAVTRWREDATQDCWGSFIYLRDLTSGEYWSTGFQPTAAAPDDYEVVFREERVTLSRRDGTLSTVLDIAVSTEDDCELRRVTLRNDGGRVRNLEITSYAEIVLAPQRADLAHPGFSNLFVSTEFVPELGCLLAMRRPRSSVEPTVWAVHLVCGTPGDSGYVEYETDRNRFIGRGRNLRAPLVIDEARPLSNTVGAVLDPIFSLRKRVSVPASGVTTVTFATLVANSRAQALELASKYRNPSIFAHVVDVAWTFARAELHHQQTSLEEARLFQVLAGHLVFASRQLRAGDDVIAANRLDISHLWRFAISGDRPIVVIRCHTIDDMAFVRQCLRAQEYLRIKQLPVDIVVLNDQRHSYIQDLQDAIEHTLRAVQLLASAGESGERGSAYALRADAMSPAELTLVLAVARAVLEPAQGSLAEQLLRPPVTATPALWQPPPRRAPPLVAGPVQSLEFFNGLGGFAEDGREYVIVLEPGRNTPA
ncbi:MAG: glucoamylase family protein, partial [Pseudomonadota bacterium]